MDYTQWTTFPEDIIPDGKYLIRMDTRRLGEHCISNITVRTGVVIAQDIVEQSVALDMPNFVGEDEHELRLFIINNEDGEEEYSLKEV